MKTRVIALCLTFILSFYCFGSNVFAEKSAVLSTFLPQNLGSMENFIEFEEDVLTDADAFKSDISKQLSACSTSLNISKYKIPVSKFKILTSYILYSLPECFNIDIEQTVSGTQSAGYVLSLKFGYNCTASQYKEMFSIFTERANAIIGDIANDNSLEDYQKALIIHDRIVVSTDYVANTIHSFDAYGALINHQAVCQGYSLAYKYLLNEIGIEAYLCNSDTLNHVWNIVKIGGKYYHVDCTWDDPTNTPTGSVYHNNFLVSTDALKTNHPANDFDTTPTSTDFDDSFWRDSYSEFIYLDGNIYYVLKMTGKISLWDINSEDTQIAAVNDRWTVSGAYYIGCFTKLSSNGTDLFFSTRNAIKLYNVQNDSVSTVFEPQSAGIGNWIYGFMYKDGEILYELNSSPNEKGDVLTYAFIEKVYSVEVLNGVLSYLCNGVLCSDYSDIAVYNGVTYLVKNGIVDTSKNSIVSLGGNLYHVTNGSINTNESPALYRFDGSYYYFENGISSQKTLFFSLSGVKYYVSNGVVNEDGSSNWVTLNDRNYFVFNGQLYTDDISFNFNNQRFTSKKGIIAHDLRTDSAEKLTCLINMILGAENTDYLYDFSRDENINILDIVEAKKELANIG